MQDESIQTDARPAGTYPVQGVAHFETPGAFVGLSNLHVSSSGRPAGAVRRERSPQHTSRMKDKSLVSASSLSSKVAKKNSSNGKFPASISRSTSAGNSSEIPPLISNGPHVNGLSGKLQLEPDISTKKEAGERKPNSSPFKIRIPGRPQIAQSAKAASAASPVVPGKLPTNVAHSSSPTPRRSSRRHASLVASNGERTSNGDPHSQLKQPNIVSGD